MNKKEKEAIIELKHFINMTPYWKQEEYNNSEIDCYIKEILNLVENQQKEIEELKKPKYIIDFKTNKITTLYNDFISKDKIRDFIKKETYDGEYNFSLISAKRLEKLLEENEDE